MNASEREHIARQSQELLRSLRKQLKWQDILRLYDQTVELIDVHPEHQKEGGIPVILVPGFSDNAEVVRESAHALAHRGRRVLCVNAPHGVRPKEVSSGLPQMRKAIALVGTLERKGIHKVDAVGHSEAAITITEAAKMRPQLFRSIILLNPAGLIINDSLPRLILSYLWDKLHETIGDLWRLVREPRRLRRFLTIMRERVRSILLDPIQSAREVHAICTTTIHAWLRSLQLEHHIGVALVQSPGERVFPPQRTAQFLELSGIPPDHIFTGLQGTHDTVLTNPEHAMEITDRALTVLEREIRS